MVFCTASETGRKARDKASTCILCPRLGSNRFIFRHLLDLLLLLLGDVTGRHILHRLHAPCALRTMHQLLPGGVSEVEQRGKAVTTSAHTKLTHLVHPLAQQIHRLIALVVVCGQHCQPLRCCCCGMWGRPFAAGRGRTLRAQHTSCVWDGVYHEGSILIAGNGDSNSRRSTCRRRGVMIRHSQFTGQSCQLSDVVLQGLDDVQVIFETLSDHALQLPLEMLPHTHDEGIDRDGTISGSSRWSQ
mmetsp:Transcript_58958/g.96048  ORF Transcript_58958/g.96048 Transcript_58958/m.96048 type:complete len:244 (-) Transcript_58958:126-857(-)